jgi:hypothetical protein
MVSNKEIFYHHFFSTLLRICYQEGQKNQERLELNGTHQLLVYADDVDISDENINTINKT